MNSALKSLCVFTHYSKLPRIPLYVSIYLTELTNYFDELILVTNERSFSDDHPLSIPGIKIMLVKNEGYDLGMFYKAFQTIDPNNYRQIACINDSNILFNQLHSIFEWSGQQPADFWGLIDSTQKPPFASHTNSYHLQSHFLVFNQSAIGKLPAFFESLPLQKIFGEKDTKKLRQMVITDWEIGLSQFLLHEGLSSASYINSAHYLARSGSAADNNVSLKLYAELIQSGYPFLKIKVITKGKLRDAFRRKSHWKNLIITYGNPDWDLQALVDELKSLKLEKGNQPLVKLRRLFH